MKHYFAYTRVSTVKQGRNGTSLGEQKEAIQRYAQQNQLAIVQWFEELETAAKSGRTQFTRMLKELKTGKADGLILHKIDRGARNLRDWASLGELIDLGIDVRFAHENLNVQSRGGRLAADIQAVVAADYIRNLREEIKKGFYGRLKQGLYPLPAPIGYRDLGKGVKEPDPIQGPLVRQAFELYASERYSLRRLWEEMCSRGLRNRKNREPDFSGMSKMLKNPFYMGTIRIRRSGETFIGKHPALVSKELFDRVQATLAGKNIEKQHRHFFLFRRLLSCAQCGYRLVAERQKTYVYYRCHTRNCPQKCIREEAVEAYLLKFFKLLRFSQEEKLYFRKWLKKVHHHVLYHRKKQKQALRLQLAQNQSRLSILTDAFIDGTIGKEIYLPKKEELLEDIGRDEEGLRNLTRGQFSTSRKLAQFLELAGNAYLSYKSANLQQKRDLVKVTTSNLKIDGQNLILTPNYPFKIVAKRKRVENGGLYHDAARTFNNLNDLFMSLYEHFSTTKNGWQFHLTT